MSTMFKYKNALRLYKINVIEKQRKNINVIRKINYIS